MSGGVLTDYRHDLFKLLEWAEKIDDVNPKLAYTLRELYEVLMKYDRFLSGDTDEDTALLRWRKFTSDFISMLDNF